MLKFSDLTRLPRHVKTIILIVVDAAIGGTTFWVAALARSGRIPNLPVESMLYISIFVMTLVPLAGVASGLYRPVVRFHIPKLPAKVGMVSLVTGLSVAFVGYIGGAPYQSAMGLGAVFGLLLFVLIILSRHEARLLLGASRPSGTSVAVYGAGSTGRELVEVLRRGDERFPVFFVDDNTSLRGRTIGDLAVLHPGDKKFKEKLLAKGVSEILLAIPSASVNRRREILEFLGDLPFHVRSVPRLSELVNSHGLELARLKEVSIEELLGRDPISPLPGLLEKCVKQKTVLVTGGGGSIGAELCRQVLALEPKALIVFDHSEFALYEIERELRSAAANGVRFIFVLGSVTNPGLAASVLEENDVDTVYHAAAYKHVPIVEHNATEGFRNNVLSTWHLAREAVRCGVKNFVLISSDKAVRPANVMGATKRMAELVIQTQAKRQGRTIFSMVRFGNVLGSSGSVVPLFQRQIKYGGPVTLTHPDITRFFMTIQEAVQLVIQAGAMASGGEVFVLDMGEPVKVKDLLLKMIGLSGRSVRSGENPSGDIAIEVIGMRPGEKLFEELLISGSVAGTDHPRIWKAQEEGVDSISFEQALKELESEITQGRGGHCVLPALKKWVSGYSESAATSSETGSQEFSNQLTN